MTLVEGKDFHYVAKPCPFCGGKAHTKTVHSNAMPEFTGSVLWVVCDDCGSSTGVHFSKEDVFTAWNKRTSSYFGSFS